MKLLAALLRIFRDTPTELLDHVPVDGNVTAKKLQRARADAAKRHGKPFRCDQVKARETEPSRDLLDLQEASAAPKTNVSKIGNRSHTKAAQ